MTLSDADKAMRRTGITATDVVRLAGLGLSGGPCDVYREKVFEAELSESDDPEWLEMGHEFEPIAIRRLQKKRPNYLIEPNSGTMVSEENPIYLATPDALVFEPKGISCIGVGEAKGIGRFRFRDWGSEDEGERGVPERVLAQIAWQQVVTGTKLGFAVAILGTESRVYDVGYSEDLALALREIADRFWMDHIMARIPPEPDGSEGAKELLKKLWPREQPNNYASSTPLLDIYAERYAALGNQIKELEAEREMAKQMLQSAIGAHEGIAGEDWKASWRFRPSVEIPATVRKEYRHFDLRFQSSKKKAK